MGRAGGGGSKMIGTPSTSGWVLGTVLRVASILLDNEAIELEFISVLIYYTYIRKQKKRESMMCRNDKSRVGPKWKTQQSYLDNWLWLL